MAVISLTITQSSTESVAGIPDTITITSNVPTIIFFTLDGTVPNTNSSVYFAPIQLPTHLSSIILTVMATDGVDTSAIISQTYTANLATISNITDGAKFPQATISSIGNPLNTNSLFPFGDNDATSNIDYTGIGNPDNTLYNQNLPSISNGYDADGEPALFSNKELDVFGTPPLLEDKNVDVIGKNGPTEYTQYFSSNNDKLFNPKSLVIYHNASNLDQLTPTIINRPHFSLENPESVKDGILLSTHTLNTPTITGSFIKSHYNPNTGTMKTYYRDNAVNRWIISEWQYSPTAPNIGNFSNLVFGREDGSQHVYPWHLWQRRTLG